MAACVRPQDIVPDVASYTTALNACHVGRSLSLRLAMVDFVAVDATKDSDSPALAAMLRKTRFVLACPLLVIGIGCVLLGRIVLPPHDRREFDSHYFGTSNKPQ